MRILVNVLDQMIKRIPEGEPLAQKLESVKTASLYRAPELQRGDWEVVSSILSGEFGVPADELDGWKKEVVDIFVDKK